MAYSLEFTETAERELSRLDATVAQEMRSALTRMAENVDAVRHHALRDPRYRGQFRLRRGDYRAIYELDRANRRVTVHRVQHRSDAYR
ncbi:MAG: type II toxin-antitoxin system RelE/ParE family toxin [Chloroflexota bacterium]|nr:type II toxin-antitoxin system RelE/ParE family toxin [Chloroflexota bacterium]MDE2960943.1 type II toxin-antitoxin system RelE/ParE family toxin [Chloroflexota bacterium]